MFGIRKLVGRGEEAGDLAFTEGEEGVVMVSTGVECRVVEEGLGACAHVTLGIVAQEGRENAKTEAKKKVERKTKQKKAYLPGSRRHQLIE